MAGIGLLNRGRVLFCAETRRERCVAFGLLSGGSSRQRQPHPTADQGESGRTPE
jgi:hypothetical protein